MDRQFRRALALVGIAALAAGIGWAQAAAPRGSVTGSVSDTSGPVAGMKVVIRSTVSAYTDTATSDSAGSFTFSNVPIGGVVATAIDSHGRTVATATGKLNAANDVLKLQLTVE